MKVAAIVLAAGAATRMGTLKQLLRYGGRTLLEHSIEQAIAAGFTPIIVVTGAEGLHVRIAIAGQPVEGFHNTEWQSGMGSSIASGVRRLLEMDMDSDAAAILLSDQPLVTADHLRKMSKSFQADTAVVAAHYNGTLGVPAVFKRELFPALVALPPEAGARHLLRKPGINVVPFPLPEAAVDIDTPEDFAALSSAP